MNDLLIEEEEHFQLFSGSDEQLDLNILRQQQQQQPRTLQVPRDQRRLELARSHPLRDEVRDDKHMQRNPGQAPRLGRRHRAMRGVY